MKNIIVRAVTNGMYDLQGNRVAFGNIIIAYLRVLLGIAPGTKESGLFKKAGAWLLQRLRHEYKRSADGVVREIILPKFKDPKLSALLTGKKLLTDRAVMFLAGLYSDMLDKENKCKLEMVSVLDEFGLEPWHKLLKGIAGISGGNGAVLLGYLDRELIMNAPTHMDAIRLVFAYGGMRPHKDGRAIGRFAEHLVVQKYRDKDGDECEKKGLAFNPFLKTRLLMDVGGCLCRIGNERYKPVYDDWKDIYTKDPEKKKAMRPVLNKKGEPVLDKKGKPKMVKAYPKIRIHRMALRRMVQAFLADFIVRWREMEGKTGDRPDICTKDLDALDKDGPGTKAYNKKMAEGRPKKARKKKSEFFDDNDGEAETADAAS